MSTHPTSQVLSILGLPWWLVFLELPRDQLNPLSGILQPLYWGLLGPHPLSLCRHSLMLSQSSTMPDLSLSREAELTSGGLYGFMRAF